MKIKVNQLRRIISEVISEAPGKMLPFLVVATDGSNTRSWVVGAVMAPQIGAAKKAALADPEILRRAAGGYIAVKPLSAGDGPKVMELVERQEALEAELSEVQDMLDDYKHLTR